MPRLRLTTLVPLLLLATALAVYAGVAVGTGQMQYLSFDNILTILGRSIALGITAVGQTFAILVASIDLSVANLISVSAVLASFVMDGDPSRMLPAIALVLTVGVLIGLVNGLVIAKLQVNPLIATLGMALILQGLLSASFNNFAGAVPESFQSFAYGTVAGLPVSLVFLLALTVLAWVFLRFTRPGSNFYAVGGNEAAAKLAGIATDRVKIMAHVLCSTCAAIAGLYLASRLRSGAPWIGRDGVYDLESIAVVVIGGTVLAGGRGGVWGTLMGVMIFSLIDATFNLAGIDAFAKQILRGVIIIAAVAFYVARSKRITA
ncbi:ABC transporter permease [Pseudooceanicola lipolyticus]|uniref:Autoinducer 2 import system permease protein LsrD n=1 Tax=Pseudooceanicola lipolyticus TaxID=2029104 RepID=A0A2M8J5A4_9RHOB|nr:ABC transporter permease [Pseudooceanicola lipolyticus]PJE37964.1 ABC transporter permease [Pseudooceanicola lipolyticus]